MWRAFSRRQSLSKPNVAVTDTHGYTTDDCGVFGTQTTAWRWTATLVNTGGAGFVDIGYDANGQQVTRSVGFAIIRLDKFFTIDEVVFAEKGDLLLLGARTLEGLNLTVDSRRKKLVAAGPIPAARAKRGG